MGAFKIKVRVLALAGRRKKGEEIELSVDTGATLTSIPKSVLAKAGVAPEASRRFGVADGRSIVRKVGHARIVLEGISLATTVIFGEEKDPPLLGVVVLEQAGLCVEPIRKRLFPLESIQQYGFDEQRTLRPPTLSPRERAGVRAGSPNAEWRTPNAGGR